MRFVLNTVAVSFVMLAFAVGAVAQQDPATQNPTVVSVNGEAIEAAEISLMMSEMAAQARRAGRQINQQQLSQMALQRVMDGTLLAQEARRRGFEVDEERIQAGLEQMGERAGGKEKLAEMLRRGGASLEVVEKTLRKNELGRMLAEKLGEDIVVTEQEARAFYEDHPEAFTIPEQVHARHILFTVDQRAGEGAKKAARERAQKARERAVAGEDFAELATELSEGPTARQGGDLGFFSREQMVEPFAEAAFSMEPGDISDIVETRFGYHVIKVEERRPAGRQEFSEIEDQLRERLKQQQIGQEIQQLLETLRQSADVQQLAGQSGGAPNEGEG